MNDNSAISTDTENKGERKSGGLYKNLKVSIKTVNIVILISIAALFVCVAFMVSHNGFTVTFDSNGGSYTESCKAYHGEAVPEPEAPVREGKIFTGWYLDRDCTVQWNFETDTAEESMTLFAGWK